MVLVPAAVKEQGLGQGRAAVKAAARVLAVVLEAAAAVGQVREAAAAVGQVREAAAVFR